MEQQTISIAKAGISTMLNARTAVLAAANPYSGRFDELKTLEENIDLQRTILSRFDMIFMIKDNKTKENDMKIAHHICSIHQKYLLNKVETNKNIKEEEFFKRYIQYARTRCEPQLTSRAESMLIDVYVNYRMLRYNPNLTIKNLLKMSKNHGIRLHAPLLPITIRQLESLIRISEGFARMILNSEVNESNVTQAIKLFNESTAQKASPMNKI